MIRVPATGPDSASARSSIERLADDLRKLSDEVLWRNHRAPIEVKDAVNVVVQELVRTAAALDSCAPSLAARQDEAVIVGHLTLLAAKDKLALLDEIVRSALHGAARSPRFIGDAARFTLALARLRSADLLEGQSRRRERERRRVEALTAATLVELHEQLAHIARACAP